MASLFKNIGRGIIYILILPFTVLGLVIAAAALFIVFLCQLLVILFRFITGRKIFEDLPEDKQAKEIIQRKINGCSQQNEAEPVQEKVASQPSITINIPYETFKQSMNSNQNIAPIDLIQQENEENKINQIEENNFNSQQNSDENYESEYSNDNEVNTYDN